MKRWTETIKAKKKTIGYGEQILSNGQRLRWKYTVKNRWVHYAKFDNYVTYLCGKTIYHEHATFSNNPKQVTCRRCIEILKEQGELI